MDYRTWENFGGRNFWRIVTDEAIGEENFGKSADSLQLFHCIFINIGEEKLGELNAIRQFFPLQNFPKYSIKDIPKTIRKLFKRSWIKDASL